MKALPAILIILVGIAAGWFFSPAPGGRGDVIATHGDQSKQRAREKKMRELRAMLLDEHELMRIESESTRSLSRIIALIRRGNHGDEDVQRLVEIDARTAMDQLLSDPGADYRLCEDLAVAWAQRDADAALDYFQKVRSFRGKDCLASVLGAAYATAPEKVAKIFAAQTRQWQRKHLAVFFASETQMRAPGAPPVTQTEDPFYDDGHWVTVRPGEEILPYLADDELRKVALYILDPVANPLPKSNPSHVETGFDPATYDGDFYAREDLRKQLDHSQEETIAKVAEGGNFQARSAVMDFLVAGISMEEKEWPQELAKIEEWMDRLDVVPEYPPRHFEMGPFLQGEVVAGWIARQPAALQRAWGANFVETWVVREPEKALEWARTLPAAANGQQAFQTGIVVWAHGYPAAAVAYVTTLPPGELRESAISNAAAAWATTDRTGARKWLESLPSSPGKDRGLMRVK